MTIIVKYKNLLKHTRTVRHGAVEAIDCEKVKAGYDWMGFAGKLLISENARHIPITG